MVGLTIGPRARARGTRARRVPELHVAWRIPACCIHGSAAPGVGSLGVEAHARG